MVEPLPGPHGGGTIRSRRIPLRGADQLCRPRLLRPLVVPIAEGAGRGGERLGGCAGDLRQPLRGLDDTRPGGHRDHQGLPGEGGGELGRGEGNRVGRCP